MKIVVINGNSRHGSTWNSKELLLNAIRKHDDIEVKDFVLPKDMPHQCLGCFSCIMRGEDKCPHASAVRPFVSAMEEADVIVLTSPIYALDISGQLKSLLDHLCFMWVSHRPNPKMFKKVGVTVATTAGFGLGHASKTMRYSLQYWGTRRIYSLKMLVAAAKWEDVKDKTKRKAQRKSEKMAKSIVRSVKKVDRLQPNLFIRFMFWLMKGMMKKNTWNLTDRSHWEAQGWLEGGRPF